MATLEENITQAISDFDDIKAAIEEQGVEVPYDTDTSEYGNKIRSIAGSGGNITVDQSYDPESPYAQSGLAVAEATSDMQTKSNMTDIVDENAEDGQYPSAKAVHYAVDDAISNAHEYTNIQISDITKAVSQIVANSIQATASGEIIRVDDVSPIEHTARAKVSCKNLYGLNGRTERSFGAYPSTSKRVFTGNGIYFSVSGSNYYDEFAANYSYNDDSITVTTKGSYYGLGVDIAVKPSTVYTISGEFPSGSIVTISQYDESGTHLTFKHCNSGDSITTEANAAWVLVILSAVETEATNTFTRVQFEEGDTATEYEPYIDPTTVIVTRCGKNLFDIDNFVEFNKSMIHSHTTDSFTFINKGNASQYASGLAKIGENVENLVGKYITISGSWTVSNKNKGCLRVQWYNAASGAVGNIIAVTNQSGVAKSVQIPPMPKEGCILVLYAYLNTDGTLEVGDTATYKNVQVEIGDTETEYEHYTAETYTPSTDGTVEITSISPTMTLYTNTEGVNIDVEYNKDTNKAFEAVGVDIETLDNDMAVIKGEMGDINTALDSIIAIQNNLMGVSE